MTDGVRADPPGNTSLERLIRDVIGDLGVRDQLIPDARDILRGFAAQAARDERQAIIELAEQHDAIYPNPGADTGPLREVLARPPFLPFADLLRGAETTGDKQ